MFKLICVGMLSASVLLTGCTKNEKVENNSPQESQTSTRLEGSFLYRERIALPPDAYAILQLNRQSQTDKSEEAIEEQKINLNGQSVPIDFTMSVMQQQPSSDFIYELQIDIYDVNGTVLFTADPAQSIDLAAGTQKIKPIVLIKPSVDTSAQSHPLIGSTWVVEDINQQGIIDDSHISFVFMQEGLVGGMSSCNNFNMPYELQDEKITIGAPGAATLKSCPPALMNQEQKFLEIWNQIKTYRWSQDNALILETENGQTLTARQQDK